jgi:serine protease Do
MNALTKLKNNFSGRCAALSLAAVMAVSVASYQFAKPAHAAATPTPAAAPLDDNTVAPLLSLDEAMENLAAKITPSIVNVTVTSKTDARADDRQIPPEFRRFFGDQFGNQQQGPQIEHGLGSGVVVSPDGYIVTNNHVVQGAVNVRVTFSDRRIFPAKVIGTDPLTDLAVIKIDGHNLASVPWGDSTKLRPGQTVLAFGNPFGFQFTVTRGIVSALNRPNLSAADRRKPGEFIQTDAAINPGNSGGPLVDTRGQVIGINTFLVSPSGSFAGMGFAIPTQIVKPTVEALIRDGKVSHGYMGVGINDVTPDNAAFFHLDNASGALVSQVEANSPGAKAGLKTGDVITGVNGQNVTDAGQLQVEIGQQQPGSTVKLDVMRDGKKTTVPVTLEAMGSRDGNDTESADSAHGKPRWGLGLGDLTPDLRQQIQAPAEVQGAAVGNVQPGSPADDAGIQRGDVIVQVNRQPVDSASNAAKLLGEVPSGKDALVLVWSNGGSSFRVMHSKTQG